jgi:hypothetical protein
MRTPFILFALLMGCEAPSGPLRDWQAHPVFATQNNVPARIWVLSDIHGGFDRLVTLLKAASLIDAQNNWTGGNFAGGSGGGSGGGSANAGGDHLYVLGDVIDKSTGGLKCLELLQGLQQQAQMSKGLVVVTLGNHEAEFLADPNNDKAVPFVEELKAKGLKPLEVASGKGIGAWMRDLPVGIKNGDWFFSHAGNTEGLTLEALTQKIQSGVDKNQFDTKALLSADSILEAQQWWANGTDSVALIDRNLAAIGATHFVFGHDPAAFGKRGSTGEKLMGRLFSLDVGMSPAVNDSEGALLLIERTSSSVTASVMLPNGSKSLLYRE